MDTSLIQIPISEQAAYLSRVHVGVTIPLLALCFVPLSVRLYIRTWPKWTLCWDDAFIVLGFMLAIADWALLQYEMFMTPQLLSFDTARNAMKLSYLAIPVWSCAMTCVKVSVALTLLRIPWTRSWKIFLYTITAVQVAYFIGNMVYTFMACIPIKGIWDLTVTDAKCLGPQSSVIASSVGSSINSLTDVLLSLAPMILVWRLRRSFREKLLVSALTGLGLVAAASSIAKAIVVREWSQPNTDTWALAVSIATLTMVEQFVAVLAASSPTLKGPLQRLLRKAGIVLTNQNSQISFIPSPRTKAGTDEAAKASEAPKEVDEASAVGSKGIDEKPKLGSISGSGSSREGVGDLEAQVDTSR